MGDLFEIQNTLSFNKDELVSWNEYDYITRTSQNQWILQETGFVNKENINSAWNWSLGLLQMDFFYRKNPWYAWQFIRKIIPKIEIKNKTILFFSVILNQQKSKLLSVLVRDVDKVFNDIEVSIPKQNWKIDFDFMERFIQDLENQKINELNNYLLATWLKDYHLTNEEEKVLADFEAGKFEWSNFEIEKLFNISRWNISNQKELIKDNSWIVFVAQNDNDNGFVDMVKPENNKQFKWNSLIVWRQTWIVYYQEKDFITTDWVLVLSSKENFIKNRKIGLAFTSSLTKQMVSFGYNNTVSAEKLNKINIQLPIKDNEPDYKLMETLISAIQKLVIKDVVIYANRKIEATKGVVEKEK